MIDVNKVLTTQEVAEKLDLNSNYVLRVAKDLKDKGIITNKDMRLSGKRIYLFSDVAVREITKKLNR